MHYLILVAFGLVLATAPALCDELHQQILRDSGALQTRLQQEKAAAQLWYNSLPPRQRQLEDRIEQAFDQYERTYHDVLPYTQQNVQEMARQIGASGDEYAQMTNFQLPGCDAQGHYKAMHDLLGR